MTEFEKRSSAEPYRLIIWGPGVVGGAALRAACANDKFEIVGVKVFSPHKHGKDAGELVGIGPIGVKATRSKSEILALDADCVLVTPQPRSILEGLDLDVIDLLESGKSVISTAAYHNVAMPNWFTTARSPTARLREIARTRGAATRVWERGALWGVRLLTSFRAFDPITDLVLRPFADRRVPARATPARLLQACRTGHSSLHGTGVHPTFMVERLLMRMCGALSRVSHIGFVEAFDISRAPEGMWGGLPFFGFGRDPRELKADWIIAKAGDFYYGDVIGNVAHALYGALPDDIRVERSFRGIPAVSDIRVGSILIRAGTTAALHMTHRGYLGNHHFFTNEEIWFLGTENAYYGEDVPFGRLPAHGGYTFKISGEPANIQGQLSWSELNPEMDHPITTVSVNALLDAVAPVCRANPGIIIADARPYYRYDDGAPLRQARRHHPPPHRVIIWGPANVCNAVIQAVQADPSIEVIPVASRSDILTVEADCVVLINDSITLSNDIDAMALALLEAGRNVLSIAADNLPTSSLREACQRGGASFHRIEFHTTLMIERIVMTMVQGLNAVRHIRIVEALDLSTTLERRMEATALGFGQDPVRLDAKLDPTPAYNLMRVVATVARDLYAVAATSVRIEHTRRWIPAEHPFSIEGLVIETGAAVAMCTIHHGYIDDRLFFTGEIWRYLGAENAYCADDLPYGGFRGSASYTIQIQADPANLESQWEFNPTGPLDVVTNGCIRMILDAIGPVCEAEPGILIADPSPRYQHDERVQPHFTTPPR